MPVVYRPAVPADAAACIDLRGRTRENAFSAEQLAALGITVKSWAAGIAQGGFRSHGFYRHLGWRPTGEIDDLGDEVLELHLRA